jgi:photosystem II stability/assembly factor-like uncharacterized protein
MKLRRPIAVVFVIFCFLLLAGVSAVRSQGWHRQSVGTTLELTGVAYTSTTNGTVIAFDSSIFRTTDGGISWHHEQNSVPGLEGINFTDSLYGRIASLETVIRTTDGGYSWSTPFGHPYEQIRAVCFTDSSTGIAVGDTTIYYFAHDPSLGDISFSEGTSFSLLSVSVAGNSGIIGCRSGVVLISTNSGRTWVPPQQSLTDQNITGVAMLDGSNAVAVGGNGIVLRTSNAGYRWEAFQFDTSSWTAVCFPDSKHGTAVGGKGRILHTIDGGEHWAYQESGTTEDLYAVNFLDANNGWIVGRNGTLLHTTNGGESSPSAVPVTTQHSSSDLSQDLLNPRSLEYALPFDADVRIDLVDPSGREQRTLREEHETSGEYSILPDWNFLHNGLYFCSLKATAASGNSFSRMWKIVVLH